MIAADRNSAASGIALLRLGALPDAVGAKGRSTPLMATIDRKGWILADELLARGADPFKLNDLGVSCMSYARENKNESFLALIEARELRLCIAASSLPKTSRSGL